MFSTTALDIFRKEASNRSIITLCKVLDRALGNGIQTGIITEFCGPPGSGKTQICYQLCVNVQFPNEVSGVGGSAVFIDTNQGFCPNRLQEIAEHGSKLYHKAFRKIFKSESKSEFTPNTILDKIQYVYCKDHVELLGAVELLKNKLTTETNIKIIVIDSFSFLFRSFESNTIRTRILYQLLTDLQILADSHSIAVVITNELTTQIIDDVHFVICPALGNSQGHKVGQRIILNKSEKGTHVAYLEKCFNTPRKFVSFQINESGVRGIDKPS